MLRQLWPTIAIVAFVGFLIMMDIVKNRLRRRARPRPEPGPTPTPPEPAPTPPPAPVDPCEADAEKVIALHNEFRARHGRTALERDARLTAAAVGHARHMARVRRMGHILIGDGDPFERIKQAGFRYSYAGENVAEGQSTPGEVCRAWESDVPHRMNMLSGEYTHVGVGVAKDDSGTPYWCVDFGRPA